jgi:hypothetical protein
MKMISLLGNSNSETSVYFSETTWRYIPEGYQLRVLGSCWLWPVYYRSESTPWFKHTNNSLLLWTLSSSPSLQKLSFASHPEPVQSSLHPQALFPKYAFVSSFMTFSNQHFSCNSHFDLIHKSTLPTSSDLCFHFVPSDGITMLQCIINCVSIGLCF